MSDLWKIIITALLSSVIAPLVLAYIQHEMIWRAQKRTELKTKAFDEAIEAIAMYETDALNIELQASKPSAGGKTPLIHFRPETRLQIERALALVEASFNQKTFEAYKAALSTMPQNIPSPQHNERRATALKLMIEELQLYPPARLFGAVRPRR
jgi:hypothetical protein